MTEEYTKKRRFDRTPEPAMRQAGEREGPLTFVVQKHAARRLHYDFRLEVDGVLKSWAVTKGPSTDPGEKRLAVMVEDHPIDYASFEGSIPAGEYGAGQVIVWDRGTYSPDEGGELLFDNRSLAEEKMRKGMAEGKLSFTLRGDKLKGSWTLVKMHNQDKNWLLIKHKDDYIDKEKDILSEEKSVISGLTIEDIKAGAVPEQKADPVTAGSLPGAVEKEMPPSLSPMLATLTDSPFSDEGWYFEPKLDGYRILSFIDRGRVRLLSRRCNDITGHYRELSEELKKQPSTQMLLDGELIALDSKGKQCFQCLQGYLNIFHKSVSKEIEPPSAIIYYVFDILYLEGFDLTAVPLQQRKELLKETLAPGDTIRLVEYFSPEGEKVFKAAVDNGLEGVVAKKKQSRYEPGKRSQAWLKIKAVKSDDFVVAGYTEGKGSRADTFGSLVLGYYNDNRQLTYAGNVGSGFDEPLLKEIMARLESLKTADSPLPGNTGVDGQVTWTKPELVVEVKFSEWTRDGKLRAPVFLRFRDDKSPAAAHPVKVVTDRERQPEQRSSSIPEVLERLGAKADRLTVTIEGQRVSFSNLDKALWPEHESQRALTKRDLLLYLTKVSPLLLPHLKDRPLSLNRFPNGITGQHFFQKHYNPVPAFVDRVTLSAQGQPDREYLLCNNLATLLWLGQIADLEIHTWFSRTVTGPDLAADIGSDPDTIVNYPDFIIFDLDPYIYSGEEKGGDEPELNRRAFRKTCEVARQLKETLDRLKFPSFIKTSGRTGLHIFLPIERGLDFRATRAAAETFSKHLLQQNPSGITTEWSVEKRRGKIFLDHNQNVRGKTLASVYSPRPSPEASVSVPLGWDELEKIYPTDFTILNACDRFEKTGDIWAHILDAKLDVSALTAGLKR